MRVLLQIKATFFLLFLALTLTVSLPAIAEARRIDITAQRFQYSPNEITLQRESP